MYQYYFRPGYKSENLLIEVFDGAENESFVSDFVFALSEIQPKMIEVSDLWMNDEILLSYDSEIGQFTLSKDIWGFAFIMAENNQDGLIRMNSILENSEWFKKVEVDFEKYR
ncbi:MULTISPECIES: hypothetical protein [Flavobacterium]|uniref:hypothetical protein n=1 Tax=Flavobacterium TaxID=237 RepID=UPI0011830BA6|nr:MULTISPECIES: hypothetical protein [Flavobacterium]MCR4032509.1 hypothetical protein [Flavobacterium panacis]